jgi:hypothetical protein
MFKISSLINPNLALLLIKKQLEKSCGFKVDSFEIHFNPKKDVIFFVIRKDQYLIDNESIMSILKNQIKQYEKQTANLYYVKLLYSEAETYILIYYTENNEKKFIKQVLK